MKNLSDDLNELIPNFSPTSSMVPQLLIRTLALLFTGWGSGISCILALYPFYQWLLPKPIVGIPFSVAATQNLLGDVPELAAEVSRTRNFNSWLKKKAESFNSPVAQVFMRPFSKPFVILSDFREIQDILLHRKDDFDRTYMAMRCLEVWSPIFTYT
jgi:hypothetical protein